jgi:hypothetical protein
MQKTSVTHVNDTIMSDKNELLEQVIAECGYTPVNTEEWYLRNLLKAARIHAAHEPVWAEENARCQQVKDAEQQKYEDKIRAEHDLSTADMKLLVDYGLLSCTRHNDNVKMSLFLVLYNESRGCRERAILMLPELQREGNINRGVQTPGEEFMENCTAMQYAAYIQDYDLLQLLLQHQTISLKSQYKALTGNDWRPA